MKRFLSFLLTFNIIVAFAQTNKNEVLPMDAKVKYGVLSNGMH